MNNNHSPCVCALLAALLLALCMLPSAALAVPLPAIDIQVGPVGNLTNVDQTTLASDSQSVVQNADGSVSFLNGSMTWPGVLEWTWTNLTVDADPAVSSVFGFTNLAAINMTYVITVDLPVAAIPTGSLIGGSMSGSVTDANVDGLGGVSTVAPTALYTGRIDGVNLTGLAEIYSDPYSSPAFPYAGGSSSIPATGFGLPGPTVPGPAVASSIGIQNKFSLSPGDIAAMTNVFIVQPVPEPSTMALGLLGSLALTWFAVRRQRRL